MALSFAIIFCKITWPRDLRLIIYDITKKFIFDNIIINWHFIIIIFLSVNKLFLLLSFFTFLIDFYIWFVTIKIIVINFINMPSVRFITLTI